MGVRNLIHVNVPPTTMREPPLEGPPQTCKWMRLTLQAPV